MGYIVLRRMRGWVLFLVTFNFLFTIGWYSYLGYLIEQNKKYRIDDGLFWGDWVYIVSGIIFFFTYIYSLRSSPRAGRGYKFARTFLLLIPTILVLYLRIDFIALVSGRRATYNVSPFVCTYIEDYICFLSNTIFWWSLITAFFVLFEIGMTLAWGPMEAPHQFGGALEGYSQDANVVMVSPQPIYSQQQQYYPHMAQQPVLLNQQHPGYKIEDGVQQPYPLMYQQPLQQQQHHPYQPQPTSPGGYMTQQQPASPGGYISQQPPSPGGHAPQPSPRASFTSQPSPGAGYISQAEQYELLQQQQQQQQMLQQQQRQQSFAQPAPSTPYGY
ncbi:hypothetical protein BG015_009709 [Linnemannia schmuckeri]|uniref:Uncharacterized protein n=1 Tax=Linnemannia schmuckeri TaxID=64567 RepID=A0A9P5V9K9_9FUNG|nr:hypothetical protein BG015_009709 [Linnemannia schmuckeri]